MKKRDSVSGLASLTFQPLLSRLIFGHPSRAMHSYTGLTIHFVDSDFNLHSHLLDTKEFCDSHTGENMANELSEILDDWKLTRTKLVCATTDNGSNVLTAMDTLVSKTSIEYLLEIL